MDGIMPELRFADKQKLIRRMRKCRQAGLKTRYLIIVNLFSGRTPAQTAAAVHVARSTVYRVATRFRLLGEWGLLDRREDNGQAKLSDHVLAQMLTGLGAKLNDTEAPFAPEGGAYRGGDQHEHNH